MDNEKYTVSVVGLGYVGLPLAVLSAKKGFKTYAIDISSQKIEMLKKGEMPFVDEDIEKDVADKKIIPTDDFSVIKEADIVIVCVPTPIDENNDPDLKPIRSSVSEIKKHLRKGHLVVIESTINPGVCDDIVIPILEESGLALGEDFDVAHCPERIDPGNKKWKLHNIARVVGSSSELGVEKAYTFYDSIIDAEIRKMKTIKEAEATKIIENTFRDINIALVNELAKSFDKMGIDLVEVIKGASTKPFAFIPHFPGCGIGGHCIPVDPYYLIEKASQIGFDHKFLKLAREINNSMPEYTIDVLRKTLNDHKMCVNGTNIGVMGLAYKPNIDDMRESPALEIIELLEEQGAEMHIFDPFVPDESNVDNFDQLLERSDVLVLVTNHEEFLNFDLNKLKQHNIKIIIDGRNCLDGNTITELGIKYKGIGR